MHNEPTPGSLTVYNFAKPSLACEIYLTIQYRGSDDADGYALSPGCNGLRPPWDHVHFIHGLCDSLLEVNIHDVTLDETGRHDLESIPCTVCCPNCNNVLRLAVPADIAKIYAVQKSRKPVSGSYLDR